MDDLRAERIRKTRRILALLRETDASPQKRTDVMNQLLAKGLLKEDLDALLRESETTSTAIERRSGLTKIPDLDIGILAHSSYSNLLASCVVDRYFLSLCRNPNLWRKKIAIDFPLRGKYLYFPHYKTLYKENPRELYEIINARSKIVPLDQHDIEALAGLGPDDDIESTAALLNQVLPSQISRFPLLRGDVIHLDWFNGDRNDDKYLWDGQQVVNRTGVYDDYGSIPESFAFPEFPLDHFFNSITHNAIIWMDAPTLVEFRNNFRNMDEKAKDQHEGYTIVGTSVISDRYQSYRVYFLAEILDNNPRRARAIREIDLTKEQQVLVHRESARSMRFLDIYDNQIITREGKKVVYSMIWDLARHEAD